MFVKIVLKIVKIMFMKIVLGPHLLWLALTPAILIKLLKLSTDINLYTKWIY